MLVSACFHDKEATFPCADQNSASGVTSLSVCFLCIWSLKPSRGYIPEDEGTCQKRMETSATAGPAAETCAQTWTKGDTQWPTTSTAHRNDAQDFHTLAATCVQDVCGVFPTAVSQGVCNLESAL